MTNKNETILQRIHNAMQHPAIMGIKKIYNEKLGYSLFLAEDVVGGCKTAMHENGILFTIDTNNLKLQHEQYIKKTVKGEKTVHYFTIQGTAIFINVDNKDDIFQTPFYGSAEDDSDKAIGKANTYAKKIALMNTFLIQDAEDTDSKASEEGISVNVQKLVTKQEEQKKKSIEINTDNEDFIQMLEKKGYKPTVAYKDKQTPVFQKWVLPDESIKIEEYLKQQNYTLNVLNGYWKKEL